MRAVTSVCPPTPHRDSRQLTESEAKLRNPEISVPRNFRANYGFATSVIQRLSNFQLKIEIGFHYGLQFISIPNMTFFLSNKTLVRIFDCLT